MLLRRCAVEVGRRVGRSYSTVVDILHARIVRLDHELENIRLRANDSAQAESVA